MGERLPQFTAARAPRGTPITRAVTGGQEEDARADARAARSVLSSSIIGLGQTIAGVGIQISTHARAAQQQSARTAATRYWYESSLDLRNLASEPLPASESGAPVTVKDQNAALETMLSKFREKQQASLERNGAGLQGAAGELYKRDTDVSRLRIEIGLADLSNSKLKDIALGGLAESQQMRMEILNDPMNLGEWKDIIKDGELEIRQAAAEGTISQDQMQSMLAGWKSDTTRITQKAIFDSTVSNSVEAFVEDDSSDTDKLEAIASMDAPPAIKEAILKGVSQRLKTRNQFAKREMSLLVDQTITLAADGEITESTQIPDAIQGNDRIHIEEIIEGQTGIASLETEPEVFNDLLELFSTDPAAFTDIPLNRLLGNGLSRTDYDYLYARQQEILKGDGSERSVSALTSSMNSKLSAIMGERTFTGVDKRPSGVGKPAAYTAMIKGKVQKAAIRAQNIKGAPLTNKEQEQIIENQLSENPVKVPGTEFQFLGFIPIPGTLDKAFLSRTGEAQVRSILTDEDSDLRDQVRQDLIDAGAPVDIPFQDVTAAMADLIQALSGEVPEDIMDDIRRNQNRGQ